MVCRWHRQTLAEAGDDGITFLDLSKGPSYWADYIYNSFIKLRNNRSIYKLKSFLLINLVNN